MASPGKSAVKGESRTFSVVHHDERKVDGIPLVTGKPKFVADIDLPDTLYVKPVCPRADRADRYLKGGGDPGRRPRPHPREHTA